MKTLYNFMRPKKKQSVRFTVSDRFLDEEGNLAVWEMRPLSGRKAVEVQEQTEGQSEVRRMAACAAEAMIVPDLHDKELLDWISEQEGRPVLSAADALLYLLNDLELAEVIRLYSKLIGDGVSVAALAEEAKN